MRISCMFRAITLSFFILSFFSCRKQASSSVPALADTTVIPPDSTSVPDSTKHFLALGDSYTIGQSVPVDDRFPHQTVELLNATGYQFDTPRYIAATGWPTEALISAISGQTFSVSYDVVSLLIGVNDQYIRHDTIGYRDRFRSLLLRSIQLAGNRRSHVFVLSIPDYSVTPFASGSDTNMIRTQIDLFNNINYNESVAANVNYLEITQSTREAANNPSLLANDGLHPSGIEYGKWAARLADQIRSVVH